jgi:6,7-dimethyl-8-ribityllumazine synthase
MTQRIAFIQSRWHADVVDACRRAFLEEASRLGRHSSGIDVFDVPGAFEIPLHAQLLARSGRYAAIAAAGLVVDGGIYRHEFVASAVIEGLMRVQLETETPVFTAVLTPQSFHGHETHLRFFREHAEVKGKELARTMVETLESLDRLRAQALEPA